MAYFKIDMPNGDVKYIKSIDRANGTIEFSKTSENCLSKDSGFWANSERDYLMFHFKKDYPELEYMTIETC